MIVRAIPSSGEEIPVIGLGTWQTFDQQRSRAAALREVVEELVDRGGSLLDTSPMYGRAEEMIGWVRDGLSAERRDALFIATKVWTRGREEGVRQMRNSLRLMGVQRADLMQIHNLVDWRVHLETLRAWREEGKVRYIGITHYLPSAFDELEAIMRSERIDFVQLPYSISMRAAEDRLLPFAIERGIAVIVNRPLEEGAIFRRVRGALPDEARRLGCNSWSELFLRYIVSHPAVTCVIPATANLDHLASNLRCGELPPWSSEERAAALALVPS